MTLSAPRIVIVGSLNMDLVARVARLPQAGETVDAAAFFTSPGGKGANQAVAVRRLGGQATMVGRVGDDIYGRQLIAALSSAGVDVSFIQVSRNCASGLAMIAVDDAAENCITFVAGANSQLSPNDIQHHQRVIAAADVLIVQLEIPLDSAVAAVDVAKQHNVMTILNPAPAPDRRLPSSLEQVDVLILNVTEAARITGRNIKHMDDARLAARDMYDRGAGKVIVTFGQHGAAAVDDEVEQHVEAPTVPTIDTTGAGDAFVAGVAVQLAARASLTIAVKFASAAGALATTRRGTQPAMPMLENVRRFVAGDASAVVDGIAESASPESVPG